MQPRITALWTRLNIIEARIQKEEARTRPDEVRLRLLERMRAVVVEEISLLEHGSESNLQVHGYAA